MKRLSLWWLVVIVPALVYAALLVFYIVQMGAMHRVR
ncbi:hypothetical protein SEA_RIKSENGUPTA_8 [Microbacterium phage RikSengupta]|nr:hypothetical protein SEA_RIKSENGUPTA_8 [Microbacterium phage RikSengupta]